MDYNQGYNCYYCLNVDFNSFTTWVIASEQKAYKDQEIYISENEIITVKTNGDVKSSNYSITRKNEKNNTIDIMDEDVSTGFGMASYFEFSNAERTTC